MKSRKYLLLLMLLLPLVSYSCKDEIITPNDPPGRRDYVWSVDTLSNFNIKNIYIALAGVSPSDIWIAGYGDDFRKYILHYDGAKIIPVPQKFVISDPQSLYNFNNEIWLGGITGDIYKYEGANFVLKKKFSDKYLYVLDFASANQNQLYAAGCYDSQNGLQGVVMKYANSEWEILDTLHGTDNQFSTICVNLFGEIYLRSFFSDSIALYKYQNKKFVALYKEIEIPQTTFFNMFNIQNNTYIIKNKRLYQLGFDKLNIVKDFSSYDVLPWIGCGKSLNDIFLVSPRGIAHYNGSDVQDIFNIGRGTIWKSLIFDKDVFFIFIEAYTNKYYFIHGKL